MERERPEEYRLSLAKQEAYFSYQGEGHLSGQPMVFVRFAGCSVACHNCDTDYRMHSTFTVVDLVDRVVFLFPNEVRDRWVWLTGGEPTQQLGLENLVRALKEEGLSVAMATVGISRVVVPIDWLSVSPHHAKPLVQPYGNELKLVPGLNGLDPFAWLEKNPTVDFWLKYLQPLWFKGKVQQESVDTCLRFIKENPEWCLTWQLHKLWDFE